MLKIFEKIKLKLQLFGEGGGGDGGAGGAAGDSAGASADASASVADTVGGPKLDKAAKAAKALGQVQYGRQEAAAAEQTEADAQTEAPAKEQPAQKHLSFDEMLKDPEYAKEMQKRIDSAINKRFAKAKAAEERSAKLAPALSLIAQKYGIKAGDDDALIEAINGDTELIEQQAMDMGMEPDAYREYTRMKAENEQLKAAEAERQRIAAINDSLADWQRQAQELQRIYPGFNLQQEAQNETFRSLLGNNIPVRTAYEVVHQQEIQQGLIQRAAQEAQRKTVAGIQAKSGRPRENAAGKPQTGTIKSDLKSLTIKDFEEIDRRLARGERIRF